MQSILCWCSGQMTMIREGFLTQLIYYPPTMNIHISNNTWNAIHVQGLIIHPPPPAPLHCLQYSSHRQPQNPTPRTHPTPRQVQSYYARFILSSSSAPVSSHQCTATIIHWRWETWRLVHCDPHECPYYTPYTHDTHTRNDVETSRIFITFYTHPLHFFSRFYNYDTLRHSSSITTNIIIASHTGLPLQDL